MPLELRREIYGYILPHTFTIGKSYRYAYWMMPSRETWSRAPQQPVSHQEIGNDIVWRRGCTRLLATNRQIHEECADMMYGDNTFVVHIAFDSIKFQYQWVVEHKEPAPGRANGCMVPNGTKDFLDHFSLRNLLRIKYYIINVELVDSYTGMIKYNCGGRGLGFGIRQQAQDLVELLAAAPCLHRLQLHLTSGKASQRRQTAHESEQRELLSHTVLDPFTRLYNVRKANVTGVSADYAALLEQSMTDSRIVPT